MQLTIQGFKAKIDDSGTITLEVNKSVLDKLKITFEKSVVKTSKNIKLEKFRLYFFYLCLKIIFK